jgi:hypothetical protein
MEISSWTKLAVVMIVCAAAIILGWDDKLDSQAVVALLSASLGYFFGNAHGVISAVQGLNKAQDYCTLSKVGRKRRLGYKIEKLIKTFKTEISRKGEKICNIRKHTFAEIVQQALQAHHQLLQYRF